MSRLSALSHPVSNTRRHGNRDDDGTPQEAKQANAGRRRTRPQTDENKRTSDERESGMFMMTGKQTGPAARSRKSTSAHASPDPAGGGTSRSKQIDESRGEGAGRKEKDDERTRGVWASHHLIARPPHIKQASHHTPAAASHPPHIRGTSTTPSRRHLITGQAAAYRRITSESFQFPSPSHRIRSSRTGRMTEAQQINHGHGITSKARYAPASRRRHDTIEAIKQPRRLPVPRHDKRGEEAGRRGANRGKAKRMTMGNIAER